MKNHDVLILVVVEDTLGATSAMLTDSSKRLNPCCSGRYSRRDKRVRSSESELTVLILVVVEDTLGDSNFFTIMKTSVVLILVVVEDTLGDRRLYVACSRAKKS